MTTQSGRPYAGFQAALKALFDISLSDSQLRAFRRYSDELQRWNERTNLTAVTDPHEIEVKHFIDSISCLPILEAAGRVVDVGAGAGFPGIPLKIMRSQLDVTLVEATRKKVDFCRHMITQLGLRGIEAVHARAEELGHQSGHRAGYDWAVARAVATLPVLVEYLLPFVRVGGQMIAMKGETGPQEAQAAEAAITVLGGRLRQLVPVELPTVVERRYLVVIDKVSATPEAYPRRPGVPAKRPLESPVG